MDLYSILEYEKITSLGYDSVFTELPMPDIVDFDYKKILEKPPNNTDRKTLKELETISRITKSRTSRDTEIVYSIDQDIDSPFSNLLKSYDIVYPQDHIDDLYRIVEPILLNIKSYWNRPRPIQLAKFYNIDIDLIQTDTTHTASYPSGHTVYSRLVSNVIKNMFRQVNSSKLDSIVLQTAKARVMQGVHYPSDNAASLIFADFVFEKLHSKII